MAGKEEQLINLYRLNINFSWKPCDRITFWITFRRNSIDINSICLAWSQRLHTIDYRIQPRTLFDFSVGSAQRPSVVIMVGHVNGLSGSDGAFPVPADKRINRTKFAFYTETLGSPKFVVRITKLCFPLCARVWYLPTFSIFGWRSLRWLIKASSPGGCWADGMAHNCATRRCFTAACSLRTQSIESKLFKVVRRIDRSLFR